MTKTVNITVDPEGKSTIEADGFSGGECIDATQAFESMFQKTVRERQMVGDCGSRKDDGERVRT